MLKPGQLLPVFNPESICPIITQKNLWQMPHFLTRASSHFPISYFKDDTSFRKQESEAIVKKFVLSQLFVDLFFFAIPSFPCFSIFSFLQILAHFLPLLCDLFVSFPSHFFCAVFIPSISLANHCPLPTPWLERGLTRNKRGIYSLAERAWPGVSCQPQLHMADSDIAVRPVLGDSNPVEDVAFGVVNFRMRPPRLIDDRLERSIPPEG